MAIPENSELLADWRVPVGVLRYSKNAFPATRYLPGINQRSLTRNSPSDESFLYGMDLYNHAYWWEAHEAWELVWSRQTPQSLDRLAMAILIAAANLNLKIALQKRKAASRLAAQIVFEYEEWRRRAGDQIFGVEMSPWFERYQAYVEATLSQSLLVHNPGKFSSLKI